MHDLTTDPHTCMRYDRHAVYLGDPGPDQDCPAGAVGRTDTVRIASDGTVTRTHGYPDVRRRRARGRGRQVPTRAAPRLPASRSGAVKAASHLLRPGLRHLRGAAADAMKTWAHASPYHAVGIYIGGLDRACPDGNLTPNWIQTVARQGWKFFPIYVGLQAPCWKDPGGGHPALIARSRRWTQGEEAADDAADRAAHFGIAQGSPIYFDMEYYPRTDTGCTQDVQAFLSAWTDQLHTRGLRLRDLQQFPGRDRGHGAALRQRPPTARTWPGTRTGTRSRSCSATRR